MAARGAYRRGVARKPFDPSLARGGLFDQSSAPRADAQAASQSHGAEAGSPAATPGKAEPITVTQACERIRAALEGTGRLVIVGEVSNFSPRNHWYFSIKDADAVLNCVMWASAVSRAAFQPANGVEVVVTGRLTYYGPSARTQIVVDRIERRGQGSLQQRFDELCRVLRSEGYFDESRKKSLPPHPRRIAVVTARHGAALQDVLRTARLRAPWVQLLVVEVPVQGEGAAAEVARAIRAVDRRSDELGIDAMIVTRGGGSLEDMWAFNERAVADAVYACRTPVVAAIGHETDTTVIELVADRRASTPTQAAMLLLPDRAQLAEQVAHLCDRVSFLARKRVRDAARELEGVVRHPMFRTPAGFLSPLRLRLAACEARLRRSPHARLDRARRRLAELHTAFERQRPAARQAVAQQRVASLEARLRACARGTVNQAGVRVEGLARQLSALGPQHVLARGYSVTFIEGGAILRHVSDAREGQPIVTRLAEGELRSIVQPAPGSRSHQ